jgi:hypothetical protein
MHSDSVTNLIVNLSCEDKRLLKGKKCMNLDRPRSHQSAAQVVKAEKMTDAFAQECDAVNSRRELPGERDRLHYVAIAGRELHSQRAQSIVFRTERSR